MLQIILVVGVGIVLGTIGVFYLKCFQKGLRDNENKQNSYLEPKKFHNSLERPHDCSSSAVPHAAALENRDSSSNILLLLFQ